MPMGTNDRYSLNSTLKPVRYTVNEDTLGGSWVLKGQRDMGCKMIRFYAVRIVFCLSKCVWF